MSPFCNWERAAERAGAAITPRRARSEVGSQLYWAKNAAIGERHEHKWKRKEKTIKP